MDVSKVLPFQFPSAEKISTSPSEDDEELEEKVLTSKAALFIAILLSTFPYWNLKPDV